MASGWTSAPVTAAGVDLGGSSRCGWRGRSREWGDLAGLLRAAENGRGGALLVEGQSGMGKSRLLAEAVEAAASRGFMLARGMADEPGRLASLKPLMSAFGESTQTLLASWEMVRSDAIDLRLWLVEELQARLEELAARGRLLVALDDLQWADPTTLLALRTLIPELASYPLVWILSRTTGSGDGDVGRLYDILERDGATRIMLEALSDQAVAEIITDVLGAAPEPDLLALAAGAGGNPFMLVELLGGLHDEGTVEIAHGHARLVSRRLPLRVQQIARSRMGRLSLRTRHLLQVAAVLGRSFRLDDLAGMLGEPPSRLLPALEEAEKAGVTVPASDTLTFRHDLLWRAVTETLTVPVRQALHRQAAEMLLNRGGSAIPAAAHLMHYARPGDTSALAGLDRAVREVLASSPQTAVDLAVRALGLTALSDPSRFERTVTAVHASTSAGRLTEAAELARAALSQTTQPGQAAQLRSELAYALYLAGRPVDAVAEAEKALSQQDLPDELRGLAEQVLFQGPVGSHAYRRGQERAEAVVAAPGHHSKPAVIGAHILLSDVAWAEGRAADGIGHAREAIRIAASDPIRRAHPRILLACLLMDMRQLDESETVLQAAIEEITALGHTAYAASPALFRARRRLAEGRLDDAAAEAHAGLAMADEMGMHLFDIVGDTVLAIVAVHQGDLDTAARHAEHCASQNLEGRGAMYAWWWGNWCIALVAEAQTAPEKAIDVLHAFYTDPSQRCWLLMVEPDAAAWLTRIALASGDRYSAETVAATAERIAHDNPGFPGLAASAAHAHGILHSDPAALSHASATHGGLWSRASAAEDLGILHARTPGDPDHDAAIHSLDQALDRYQQAGATRDAARVRARLRKLGVRRRHWSQSERPISGWASLTDTERNVATLVAQGLTNPQVATQMFISPHTVKFHLHQIFRKLHIGSRVELAAKHTPDATRAGT